MEKRHILFVDDEVNVLEGLRRMLRGKRHEWDMVFAANGPEALARMAEAPADVVVVDLQMAGMDGAELLEEIVRKYPDTARIVLSGHADENTTNRVLKVTHQFLFKPTDPEEIKLAVTRACGFQNQVRSARVRDLVAPCDTLPSLPGVYLELEKAVESETANAKQVARIISRDMAMSAKLLQLVNSSFFGIGRRVSSVEQTVTLLGLLRIKALVLTEHVFKQFRPSRRLHGFSLDWLWRHSVAVAEVARLISMDEQQDGDRPDQAFMAGLLHDIGFLVLASRRPEAFQKTLALVPDEPVPTSEAERECLGVTHAEIGGYLLGLWGLPMRIVEAVAFHHNPHEVAYENLCATTVVHVADALVRHLEVKEGGEKPDPSEPVLDRAYLQRIKLEHRLERWTELARKSCQEGMETPA